MAVIALLYFLFSWGALTGKRWARPVGLAACVVNTLAVLVLGLKGDSLGPVLFWMVVPVIVGAHLLGLWGRPGADGGSDAERMASVASPRRR